MSRKSLISKLVNNYNEDIKILRNMSKDELENLLGEYEDSDDMFSDDEYDEYDNSYN